MHQIPKDFKIVKSLPLPELQSQLTELVHEPSKAKILHIGNLDPENLFCLSFQTIPTNSNGVAHILEHTVLCGSQKYPVKDPFFSMMRRSLNTFMNAFTGQDFTCYPASSQVEKDFYNLLSVYLDAVFHPELKKMSFLQEGHRLEFKDPVNSSSDLLRQGVVYNEMKGAMASVDSRLWAALFKALTPDLTYAHNSGGDPKHIPELTYEGLLEFHRTFYHPSRCLFFFYGNIPLQHHLDFLLQSDILKQKPLSALPPLPRQPRFSHPKRVSKKYLVPENESTAQKTILAFAWLTAPTIEQEEILALSLLDLLLMDNDASPLRRKILESGLCTSVSSTFEEEMSEVPWCIICKGSEEKHGDPLETLIFETLKSLASAPFSEQEIASALHQLEFERTEIDGDGGPFGLTLFMRAGLLMQHGGAPESALLIHTLFKNLRAKLANPTYLSQLMEKYFIQHPHFVRLTLIPDPHLAKQETEEEISHLKTIQNKLSATESQEIVRQYQTLTKYQEELEETSLDCLPKIKLHEIPHEVHDFPLEKVNQDHCTILNHSSFTNEIIYADLFFDLPHIPLEDLPLVSLFIKLLPEVGSGGKSYTKTLQELQAFTGEVSAALSLHILQKNPNQCRPSFCIKGKALNRNSPHLLQFLADFATTPDFSDRERLKELIEQHVTGLQSRFTNQAMNYAIQSSLSSFSIPSFVQNQWGGLPYYETILQKAKNIDSLIDNLQRIKELLLPGLSPTLVLSTDSEEWERLKKNNFHDLSKKLKATSKSSPWQGNYSIPENKSHVHFIPSPMAFTALGMKTVSYQNPIAPFLLLSTELLQNCYLHQEIREKGGAYGASSSYAATTGNFYLQSYRDPQLTSTLKAFNQALDSLASGDFSEEDLEEAKLCVLQTIDAPVIPQNRATTSYAWMRAGRTKEDRIQFRSHIVKAKKEEIINAAKTLLPLPKITVSFLGKELFEKENISYINPGK